MKLISIIYNFLWGDLVSIPLWKGQEVGLSLMVLMLIPTGIYFTIKSRCLPLRFGKEMIQITLEKEDTKGKDSISGLQTLIVSTATRVGMGNMVGVVAALSAGGAGAVFWMWITALIGSSTAFVEAVLAQLHKQKDPLYGGFRGGPAYYIHDFFDKGKKKRHNMIAVFFALSALLCWCGVSQVISNSVSSALYSAYQIPPIVSTLILVILAAIIVLRKNATVKVLDILVPIMAISYFATAILIMILNIDVLPSVFVRIFREAFTLDSIVGGSFGAVLMNGVKRGLFSNEAGSGSAPCAAAAADVSHPVKAGLFQAFGVIIDTIVICTCTAMIMLLVPQDILQGLEGMSVLTTSMQYHFGDIGVLFTVITLWLFSFSTFIGILFYARGNVAYLFGDNWISQSVYKILTLIMLFIGGLATYTFVWDLGDIGIGLMTIFNIITILPMSKKVFVLLEEYCKMHNF